MSARKVGHDEQAVTPLPGIVVLQQPVDRVLSGVTAVEAVRTGIGEATLALGDQTEVVALAGHERVAKVDVEVGLGGEGAGEGHEPLLKKTRWRLLNRAHLLKEAGSKPSTVGTRAW